MSVILKFRILKTSMVLYNKYWKFLSLSTLQKLYRLDRKIQITDSGFYVFSNLKKNKKNVWIHGPMHVLNFQKIFLKNDNINFRYPLNCLVFRKKNWILSIFVSLKILDVFFDVSHIKNMIDGSLVYRSILKKISMIGFFKSYFKNINIFLHLGIKDSLEITGYFRRMWFSKNPKYLNLKVGNSYINRILIPKIVILKLIKKRVLFLFSFDLRFFKKFVNTIVSLQSADPYKSSGIRLKSKNLFIKEKFNKK